MHYYIVVSFFVIIIITAVLFVNLGMVLGLGQNETTPFMVCFSS